MSVHIGNLLCMFDESLSELDESVSKIVRHLERGYPERALMRAQETQKKIVKMQKIVDKVKKHACGDLHNNVEKEI